MIDISNAINIGSAVVVVVSTVYINREGLKNLKESLTEFKKDIKDEIKKEKTHAMELASQRISTIEKDVDEIFPRLRVAEGNIQKNCFAISAVEKNCIKHREAKNDKIFTG